MAYTSTLIAGSEEEAQQLLARIFAQSLRNNPALEIGGVLYFNPANFTVMQILEGPSTAVATLFDKVSADPRHEDVKILARDVISESHRRYVQFGMHTGTLGEQASWFDLLFHEESRFTKWLQHSLEGPLLRITYASVLCAASEADAYRVIAGVLEQSVRNNRRLRISGTLLFNQRTNQ